MQLEGSCHCGAVSFTLDSAHPYPYQRCYCSICRKTQGGGGFAINLGGDAQSLKVRGRSTSRSTTHDSRTKAIYAPTAAAPNGISVPCAVRGYGCSVLNGRS